MTIEFTAETDSIPFNPDQIDQDLKVIIPRARNLNPSVTVVVPAMNEEKNLRIFLPDLKGRGYEVLLIDGHSKDNTVQVAKEIMPSIRVIQQEGKGKGAALRTGFKHASGDIIVMIDADCSMDANEIPAFIGALKAGADFAKGSRFIQGGGTVDMELYRKVGNWGLMMLVRLLYGGQYSDLCYGYNAFWKSVLPYLDLQGDGFEIETEMNIRALKAGLKVAEVPSFEAERVHGVSNLNTIKDGFRVLNTIITEKISRRQTPRLGQPQKVS